MSMHFDRKPVLDFHEPSGTNFHLKNDVEAQLLCKGLCRCAAVLQSVESHSATLRQYDDWWEHDGLHFYKRCITFHDLFAMISSPKTLLAAMPGDHLVFVGIAPQDSTWYLRFHVDWDADDCHLVGRFDLTVPDTLKAHVRQTVVEPISDLMLESESSCYYAALKNLSLIH